MSRRTLTLILFNLALVIGIGGKAQEFHTMTYNEAIDAQEATIGDISWIAGNWRGEAFGGIVEENWSKPNGGSMMASFKLVVDNETRFYELITISELEGTLVLYLRHFSKDLKGWEEKDTPMVLNLVKRTNNAVYFDGMTFERISDNEIHVYVMLEQDGKKKEHQFVYKKDN